MFPISISVALFSQFSTSQHLNQDQGQGSGVASATLLLIMGTLNQSIKVRICYFYVWDCAPFVTFKLLTCMHVLGPLSSTREPWANSKRHSDDRKDPP